MSESAGVGPGGLVRSAILRGVGFLVMWLMLSGARAADLPAAAVAVVAATWASVSLLPPSRLRPRPVAIARFALRFLGQSVVAGVDVARRVLAPRLSLRPGFAVYPVRLPSGQTRNAFCALTSLVPGTLPTGPDERGALLVHCLDVDQPIAAQLALEESLLSRAMGRPGGDD
ncbi:MAG TPA: Na+/H+ antiporter subunit E [Candidatus Methylomirabilis sp.]|nr:Na+/H+ antiporter subunit E [Candidatus Methylomirabilis sp.]